MELQDKIPADSWDMVIGPPKGWFDLHLRDLWRYRDLVGLFVRRDFGGVAHIGEKHLAGGPLG